MASILTLTLNPTIDITTTVARLEPVHKLRCGPMRRDPGGGGINVARVVRRLGGDVVAIYPTGGLIGALLRKLTDAEGVESLAVPIADETREDFTVLEEASGEQYRFVLPGPHLQEAEWRACLEAVDSLAAHAGFVVVSGSLPPGVPADVIAMLAQAAKGTGTKLVVDSSGAPLRAAVAEGVHLIKPSLREMRELTGEPLSTKDQWVASARRLVASGKVERVALSLGEQGALLAAADGVWHARAVPVGTVSAVGAGDSFLGALVLALSRGEPHAEALRLATAAGTATLLTQATELCHAQDIEWLRSEVVVEQIC